MFCLPYSGFDGCIKVWSVDPSLDEIACQLVKSEQYFGKETMGSGGGGGDSDFRHLGKVSWQPEVSGEKEKKGEVRFTCRIEQSTAQEQASGQPFFVAGRGVSDR